MATFDSVFKEKQRPAQKQHPKVTVMWLHYSKLHRSPYQIYSEKEQEIRNLADLIQTDGQILQPLVVRQSDADAYEIIAGHKRRLACKILVEERGLEKFAFLPCNVTSVSDARAEFQVYTTNQYRDKSDYEIMCEIENMQRLMEQYPEEFTDEELRGRMVERLARQLNICRSVISDYKNIAHNLCEEGMEAFKDGSLDKSAANAMAGLPVEEQQQLLSGGVTSHKEIRQYKKSKKVQSEQEKAEKVHQEQKKQKPSKQVLLPDLKNNDQRKEFLDGYASWPIWLESKETGERYYRYDLQGAAFVVKVYYHQVFDAAIEAKRWEDRFRPGWGSEEYYLIEEGKYFKDCQTNRSCLVDYLKKIQKE